MSNKSRFRGQFEKEPGKRAQTLLKSERQHFYRIYWSLWKQLSWKKSLLGIFKILRLFVNSLTKCDKYSLLNRDTNVTNSNANISKAKNCFQFFFRFLKPTLHFEYFQKKMTVLGDVFPMLLIPKNKLDQCLISPI